MKDYIDKDKFNFSLFIDVKFIWYTQTYDLPKFRGKLLKIAILYTWFVSTFQNKVQSLKKSAEYMGNIFLVGGKKKKKKSVILIVFLFANL